MTHSPLVILDFVGQFYKMDIGDILSESQRREVVTARDMVILLGKGNRDVDLAKVFGMSRPNITNSRKAIVNLMTFDKKLRRDFDLMSRGLLNFEIADLRMNQDI